MLKKMILSSVILALTSTAALANPAFFNAKPAPYIGAGLSFFPNGGMFTIKDGTVVRNVLPNLFAGYGGVINQNFYLAGELNYNIAAYGASILPGLMLSKHTLVFARAGVIRGKFLTLDSANSSASLSHSRYNTGGQFGLGVQTSLTQKIDVRGEYTNWYFPSAGSPSKSVDMNGLSASLIYKFD